MELRAIYRRVNTSKPDRAHKKYPYLLRNVAITRPNHVWSTDITYIRLKGGFAYLCAEKSLPAHGSWQSCCDNAHFSWC